MKKDPAIHVFDIGLRKKTASWHETEAEIMLCVYDYVNIHSNRHVIAGLVIA